MHNEKLFQKFLNKAFKVHQDAYDYSKAEYQNCKIQIDILCNTCGNMFSQTPDNHLQGKGCPWCAKNIPYDFDNFKNSYQELHNNKYKYLKTFKKDSKIYLEIECPVHGVFNIRHEHHLNGIGCKRCSFDTKRITKEDFLSRVFKLYSEEFSYKSLEDLHFRKTLTITCKEGHTFKKRVKDFLAESGCPDCQKCNVSKAETALYKWVLKYFPNAVQTYRSDWLGRLSLDIFIPDLNLAIEYNGTYWHSLGHKANITKDFHLNKYSICKDNGVNLIFIWEHERLFKWQRVLDNYFKNPENFEISFENTKQTIKELYTCYGVSKIRRKT